MYCGNVLVEMLFQVVVLLIKWASELTISVFFFTGYYGLSIAYFAEGQTVEDPQVD